MSNDNPGQMIQAPNTLRLKVGGRLGAIDPAAIAKAEAALKSLSGNFAEWLADEVAKLEAARQRIKSEGPTTEAAENLYLRAHDLKGLGANLVFATNSTIDLSASKDGPLAGILIFDDPTGASAPAVPPFPLPVPLAGALVGALSPSGPPRDR